MRLVCAAVERRRLVKGEVPETLAHCMQHAMSHVHGSGRQLDMHGHVIMDSKMDPWSIMLD